MDNGLKSAFIAQVLRAEVAEKSDLFWLHENYFIEFRSGPVSQDRIFGFLKLLRL
jgi:hypothetical protein